MHLRLRRRKADDRDRALELIGEARRASTRLRPAPAPQPQFRLDAPQVALYEVGVHWSLGDAGNALAAGRDLHTAQFSTPERRGRLHTDMARAWWQRGSPEQTARRLLAAYQQAPGEVRDRPSIRKIADDLVNHHGRISTVRELAAVLPRS